MLGHQFFYLGESMFKRIHHCVWAYGFMFRKKVVKQKREEMLGVSLAFDPIVELIGQRVA